MDSPIFAFTNEDIDISVFLSLRDKPDKPVSISEEPTGNGDQSWGVEFRMVQ